MSNFPHFGLFFTQSQVDSARQNAAHPLIKAAWDAFHSPLSADTVPLMIWHAQHYRFENDRAAGDQAVKLLQKLLTETMRSDAVLLDSLMTLVAVAQGIELLRTHPASDAPSQLDLFAHQLDALSEAKANATYTDRLWFALLDIVGGIVLERKALVQQGAAIYRQTVDQDIRPTGYFTALTESKDGQNYRRMVLSVKALVLMAEAASHIGLDLWSHNQRGVSVVTAALYPLYYYFYPEKWQWDTALDADGVKHMFKSDGGWLEIVNKHIGTKTHAIDLILNEIRPIFDATGGGFVTLSHSVVPPVRRGLFR